MDPNLNRNSMWSRAGGVNLRNNLTTGAPSRLGTAGRVKVFLFRVTQPSVELVQLSMFRIDLSQI